MIVKPLITAIRAEQGKENIKSQTAERAAPALSQGTQTRPLHQSKGKSWERAGQELGAG